MEKLTHSTVIGLLLPPKGRNNGWPRSINLDCEASLQLFYCSCSIWGPLSMSNLDAGSEYRLADGLRAQTGCDGIFVFHFTCEGWRTNTCCQVREQKQNRQVLSPGDPLSSATSPPDEVELLCGAPFPSWMTFIVFVDMDVWSGLLRREKVGTSKSPRNTKLLPILACFWHVKINLKYQFQLIHLKSWISGAMARGHPKVTYLTVQPHLSGQESFTQACSLIISPPWRQ